MPRWLAAVLISLLVFPAAIGQFTERIEVRVHELEVVVETRDGKPVTDLQMDDFLVLQDGVPQTITNFSVVNETGATASAAANPPPAMPQRESVPRKPRKFVFFLDEFGMHDATRRDLLRQSAELVGVMRDGDEAMIVTPASPQRIPLFFTPDKHLLMTTLERLTGQMMRKGDVRSLGDKAVTGSDSTPLLRVDCGQSLQKCAEERLADLKSIVRALGQIPGKKVLILLTTHMSSVPDLALTNPDAKTPGEEPKKSVALPLPAEIQAVMRPGIVSDFRNLQPLMIDVARTAAAGNVMIYGLEGYEPGEQALTGITEVGRTEEVGSALKGITDRGSPGTQDLLQTLADTTGARAYSGMREAGKMFEQISRDLAAYYSIAYRATDSKSQDHRVEVRIRKHPELVIRTRKSVRLRTAEEEERGKAMSALLSSSVPNTLGIRLGASAMVRLGRNVDLPVHVHVRLSRLAFVQDGDRYRAKFKVLIAAVGERDDFGDSQVEHVQDIVVPQSRWDAAQSQQFTYDTTVRVNPGKYRVAVGVTDVNSGESGFQTFSVDAR